MQDYLFIKIPVSPWTGLDKTMSLPRLLRRFCFHHSLAWVTSPPGTPQTNLFLQVWFQPGNSLSFQIADSSASLFSSSRDHPSVTSEVRRHSCSLLFHNNPSPSCSTMWAQVYAVALKGKSNLAVLQRECVFLTHQPLEHTKQTLCIAEVNQRVVWRDFSGLFCM